MDHPYVRPLVSLLCLLHCWCQWKKSKQNGLKRQSATVSSICIVNLSVKAVIVVLLISDTVEVYWAGCTRYVPIKCITGCFHSLQNQRGFISGSFWTLINRNILFNVKMCLYTCSCPTTVWSGTRTEIVLLCMGSEIRKAMYLLNFLENNNVISVFN